MAIFDDEAKPFKPIHEIGGDLSMLSADELDQRISALRAEIERLESERARKSASRDAAESFFR